MVCRMRQNVLCMRQEIELIHSCEFTGALHPANLSGDAR